LRLLPQPSMIKKLKAYRHIGIPKLEMLKIKDDDFEKKWKSLSVKPTSKMTFKKPNLSKSNKILNYSEYLLYFVMGVTVGLLGLYSELINFILDKLLINYHK